MLFPVKAKKKTIVEFARAFKSVRTQEWLATDLIRCTSSALAEQLRELTPDGVQWVLDQTDWESEIAGQVETQDWKCLSAGEGAKGPRLYDWAIVLLGRLQVAEKAHLGHYLLHRRSPEEPFEVTYYVSASRAKASLQKLVKVAGQRWPADLQ